MSQHPPIGGIVPLDGAAPELSYPGLSPQLLARITQLWSAAGLDFDSHWRLAIRSLQGFRALPRVETSASSTDVDLVFLFDQSVIWVRALHGAANAGRQQGTPGLSPAQWHGLAAISARLTEQLAALRLLALTDLPMPKRPATSGGAISPAAAPFSASRNGFMPWASIIPPTPTMPSGANRC